MQWDSLPITNAKVHTFFIKEQIVGATKNV